MHFAFAQRSLCLFPLKKLSDMAADEIGAAKHFIVHVLLLPREQFDDSEHDSARFDGECQRGMQARSMRFFGAAKKRMFGRIVDPCRLADLQRMSGRAAPGGGGRGGGRRGGGAGEGGGGRAPY